MTNSKRTLAIIVLFMSLYAHGQSRVSLDSILSVVKEKNPILKSYRSRADAMDMYASGANNMMAPEVGGGLWMLPYKKVTDERDKGQIMLSVQQKFTNPAKLRASQGFLESKAAIEQASEMVVFNELKAQARLAYDQWKVFERKKVLLKKNEEILEFMLKQAQVRYPYNQGKLGAIYKVEGKLQEIRNMILMNDNQIIQKNIQLDRLMNAPATNRFSIDTTFTEIELLPVASDNLEERRSDVRRIDKSIQAMKLNQTMESYQSKPDFNVSFNHMIARGSGMPNQFMLLGMVSIPIAPWSSKTYKSNVLGMDKEIEALNNERESIINEAEGITASLVLEINTLKAQIENYEKRILPALQRNYETLHLAYEENKEDLPAVLDGWEAIIMTQLQYLDVVQNYYETIVSYEKELEK